MYIDKEHFNDWMRRIMERFDKLEKMQASETVQSRTLLPDGDIVCLQAKVHQSHLSVLYFKPS